MSRIINYMLSSGPKDSPSAAITSTTSQDVLMDDIFAPLTRQDSYHSDVGLGEEPGIYSKLPRITVVKSKQDAMTNVSMNHLKEVLQIRTKMNDHSPIWVDAQGMDDEGMSELAEIFGIHPLTVEDCTVADTREKIENRNAYIFMVVHDFSVHSEDHSVESSVNLNMIIFHDLLLTVHSKSVHSIYAVVPKLEYCQGTIIPSIEFVLYIILARILDYHEALVGKIEAEAESLDDQVVMSGQIAHLQSSELLAKIGLASKRAASLLDGLDTKRETFAALMRYDSLFSNNGMRYIKNANDQVIKLHIQANLTREMLSDISTLYMAKLNVQLSHISNQAGRQMRRFGAIGTIFLPLNLIAGIFGMNVLVPQDVNSPTPPPYHAFIAVMLIMLVISSIQIAFFRALKWL